MQRDGPHLGKFFRIKREKGFGDGHVDVHRSARAAPHLHESLVYHADAPDAFRGIPGLRQRDGAAHHAAQGVGLRKGLAHQLVDLRGGTVGGDEHHGGVLIKGLGGGGCLVEKGRAGRDTNGHGGLQGEAQPQGIEARRALVRHRIARDVRANSEVVDDGSIAAAGANDGMTHAMGHEQGRKDAHVLLIAIHD